MDLLYARGEERTDLMADVERLSVYFKRGGPFYQALSRSSQCVHWCTVVRLT